MLKELFLIIIFTMIILHVCDKSEIKPIVSEIKQEKSSEIVPFNTPKDLLDKKETSKEELIQKIKEPLEDVGYQKNYCGNPKNIESFADSGKEVEIKTRKPWSKITLNEYDDFPYRFYIKAKIPSLNDYNSWKQVISNLDFSPKTGELIIPSKDESSALALANLMIINFLGQLSLQDILEKNLIQISVNKSKNYEMVQNKLREQIIENLYGKNLVNEPEYNQDLSKNINFQSEKFIDTFPYFNNEHFTESNEVSAYQGSDFSYL